MRRRLAAQSFSGFVTRSCNPPILSGSEFRLKPGLQPRYSSFRADRIAGGCAMLYGRTGKCCALQIDSSPLPALKGGAPNRAFLPLAVDWPENHAEESQPFRAGSVYRRQRTLWTRVCRSSQAGAGRTPVSTASPALATRRLGVRGSETRLWMLEPGLCADAWSRHARRGGRMLGQAYFRREVVEFATKWRALSSWRENCRSAPESPRVEILICPAPRVMDARS